MDIHITSRITRNGSRIYYTLAWGKKAGQRLATGIFTYIHTVNRIQEAYNKEAFRQVEIQKQNCYWNGNHLGPPSWPYRPKDSWNAINQLPDPDIIGSIQRFTL